MVIFDDLQKLLLYQRLNLGFECHQCKKKFYNKIEHLEHTSSCKSVPDLKCPKCGKIFGHLRILQLHMQFHTLSESSVQASPDPRIVKSGKVPESLDFRDFEDSDNVSTKEPKNTLQDNITHTALSTERPESGATSEKDQNNAEINSTVLFKILDAPKKKSSHKSKEKPKPVKKVGLTKIKMEDCLRCDACSCIYIDKQDYYKHMRNFHQRDMNNLPIPQQKAKRKCRSCCKQCRGSHCTPVKRPRATQRASNLIFRINMRDNIKNRWSQMVSQQLNDCPAPDAVSSSSEPELVNIKTDPDSSTVTIKQEPELDLSHLLSQVEVKIKTEPPDDY